MYIILCPFWVVDAQLEWMLRILPTTKGHTQRKALSSGSARYTYSYSKIPLIQWEIRAITEQGTVVEIFFLVEGESAIEDLSKLMQTALERLGKINAATGRNQVDALIIQANQIGQRMSNLAKQLQGTKELQVQVSQEIEAIARPAQPKRGDSIDDWLDWREQEAKRHNKITLQRIATEGGFTLISVKRASAERIRRGDKD